MMDLGSKVLLSLQFSNNKKKNKAAKQRRQKGAGPTQI